MNSLVFTRYEFDISHHLKAIFPKMSNDLHINSKLTTGLHVFTVSIAGYI